MNPRRSWAGIVNIPASFSASSTLVLAIFTCFAPFGWLQAHLSACGNGDCCTAPKIGPVTPFINFNVNPTYGVEGIAISPHNDIYIGSVYEGEIHKVDPNGKSTLFAKLVANPNDGYLLGLVVAEDETLFAAVWGCNAPINGVWHIDKDGHSRLAMPMPGAFCASIPNNLTYDEDGNLYATDSAYGSVWRLGRYGDITQWVQDPLLMPIKGFGANGAAYRNHSLWIVNSDQGSIVQIPINGDGSAGKPRIFVKSAVLGYPDDDNFDACGNLWVGDIGNGNLVRISPEGVPEIMITAAQFNGFFWPTNPVFGFRELRSTVFITGANPSVVKVDLGVPGMIPPQFDR